MTYCATMKEHNEAVKEAIAEIEANLKAVEKNYDAMLSPMPCGHLARYAVNEEDGTQYCCLCSNGASYDELKNAALIVTKSFECYTAENKPESEYDEYDSWMFPAWKKLLLIVRGDK